MKNWYKHIYVNCYIDIHYYRLISYEDTTLKPNKVKIILIMLTR